MHMVKATLKVTSENVSKAFSYASTVNRDVFYPCRQRTCPAFLLEEDKVHFFHLLSATNPLFSIAHPESGGTEGLNNLRGSTSIRFSLLRRMEDEKNSSQRIHQPLCISLPLPALCRRGEKTRTLEILAQTKMLAESHSSNMISGRETDVYSGFVQQLLQRSFVHSWIPNCVAALYTAKYQYGSLMKTAFPQTWREQSVHEKVSPEQPCKEA